MPPADLDPCINRVDGLHQSLLDLDGGSVGHTRILEELQHIRGILVGLTDLIASYGDILSETNFFDGPLKIYEDHLVSLTSKKKHHHWLPGRLRRPSQGQLVQVEHDIRTQSIEILAFLVQFALCNTSLKGPLPSDSAFTSLFFELLKLRTSVEAIKLVEESDHDIPKELRAQAGALRQLWERLCTEGGVEKEERLPAGEIMTSGHLRFWVARQWHEPLVCEHSPARVTSTDWRFPLRRRSNGHFMASLKVKDKEYYLCDYQRSSKQKAIQWTGYDDKKNHITIEHNLWAPKKDLTPNTLHSSLNDGRIVRFPGKQQVVIKEYHHIILEDTRKIEYTFVDIRYSTRFHEDLRARKQKACVDVVTISSTEGPEANLEKLYLWRDVQRSDVQFHTLSYFSSKAEHREVEFPILWFRALLKREGSRTLILTFLSSSNRELRRSSTSSVSDTFGDMYVPKEEKQTLMQYQYLKIEFESVAECETFQADFEAIHYEDTLVHLLHCLPVPTSASMRRERTEVPHSHTSSNSTNTNATGHSSDRLTRGPSSNSSIDWWPPDWFPLTTQSPTSPSLPKPEPDGDPWAFV